MISVDDAAAEVLTVHQRKDIGSCLCGWAELGRSHSVHQAKALRAAGLLSILPGPVVGLCSCHRESGSHELCCGRPEGRDPDCAIHGDGSTGGPL